MSLIFQIEISKLFQALKTKISHSHKDFIKHPQVLLTVMEVNLMHWAKLRNSKDTLVIKVGLDNQDHLLNKE